MYNSFLLIRKNSFDYFFTDLMKKAKSGVWPFFILLLFFIFFGFINGYFQGNNPKDIFFDFNGWLYFLLLFPLVGMFESISDDELAPEGRLGSHFLIILVSIIWLSLKTLVVLFIFSHDLAITSEIYHWIRDTRVGEITRMDGGFFRVFLQSHIFILPAFFVAYLYLVRSCKGAVNSWLRNKQNVYGLLYLSLLFCIIILGVSRSNWVGLSFGLIVFFVLLFFVKKFDFKGFFRALTILVVSGVLGFVFMTAVINFPLPGSGASLDTFSLVTDRASEVGSEAGAASRWSLLPKILTEIKKYPLLGKGFGSTVTYVSNDPRVREQNPSGEYTTFAFEWGWLDIWYKLGLLGLISYLTMIFFVLKNIYIRVAKALNLESILNNGVLFGLGVGLISICATSVFSPYMNHPLGISFFLFVTALSLKK